MSESPGNVFVEQVEGIGQFTFLRRTMRLEIKSKVERERLSEGVTLDWFMVDFLTAISDLKVLIFEGPKGWAAEDIDDLDPFDDEVYGRVLKVWSALRGKEETFRTAGKKVPAGGEGGGG